MLSVAHYYSNLHEDTQPVTLLDPIVVSGVTQTEYRIQSTILKQHFKPLPAGDGADLIQTVANGRFTSKGGSSYDPVNFRWVGGSTLEQFEQDDQSVM